MGIGPEIASDMTTGCPVPGCPDRLPAGGVMCSGHWTLTPVLIKNLVLDALIAGEGLAEAVKRASDSVLVLEALRKKATK